MTLPIPPLRQPVASVALRTPSCARLNGSIVRQTKMNRSVRQLQFALLACSLVVSCTRDNGSPAIPAVPAAFDVSLLQVLACPENLSKVRLATETELKDIRVKVAKGIVRYRDGRAVPSAFEGLLIRADARVGYAIKDGVADMLPDNGLALDPSVGSADPTRYRR